MRPRLCALASLLLASPLGCCAAELPLAHFQRVEVAPTWTSIYIGTVSLKVTGLTRNGAGDFEAAYEARVLPYFFYNEKGRITIHATDALLRTLERGEIIEFTGRAVNESGEERRVTGKATPSGPLAGKIKVRVAVSPRIELIFNTTYRFPPP